MPSLTLFRILSFVLIPIAALFGFLDILVLLSALANPSLLLVAFILGCFVIYSFVSLQFLTKGIDTGRPCKPSLRDWIRVNAFVSAFVGCMFLLNSLSIFFSTDASLKQLISQLLESQPNVPAILTPDLFLRIMKAVAWFMFFVSVALLIHIFLNFRLLKQYRHLFETPAA